MLHQVSWAARSWRGRMNENEKLHQVELRAPLVIWIQYSLGPGVCCADTVYLVYTFSQFCSLLHCKPVTRSSYPSLSLLVRFLIFQTHALLFYFFLVQRNRINLSLSSSLHFSHRFLQYIINRSMSDELGAHPIFVLYLFVIISTITKDTPTRIESAGRRRRDIPLIHPVPFFNHATYVLIWNASSSLALTVTY